jgi:hypothetical protein
VPTVIVPGVHTATIPVSSGSYGTANVQSWARLAQDYPAYLAGAYPHLDASARACVAHHAAHASTASTWGGGWHPGAACPALGPEDPRTGSIGGSFLTPWVGWQTEWRVPTLVLQTATYDVRVAQATRRLDPMQFTVLAAASPSWIAAAESVLPSGQEWLATAAAQVLDITATATFRAGTYSGASSLGVTVIRRSDAGADSWTSPGEVPGTIAGWVGVSAGGETVTVDWDEVLDTSGYWLFRPDNVDTDLGYAPASVPGSATESSLTAFSSATVTATFTGTVTYSEVSIAGVPPLHAAQRRGGTDAHAAHSTGADTRQSRRYAKGPL